MTGFQKPLAAALNSLGATLVTLALGLSLVLASAIGSAPAAWANNAQYTFETEAQERQFRQLINELRCPKCQNQTIADSDAPLALDLRERVYQMTMEGQSREEIIEFMRSRYGDFVHYKPPMNATTMILWAGPGLVLLIGFATILRLTRNQRKDLSLNVEEQARLDALLAAEQVDDAQDMTSRPKPDGEHDTQERRP